MCLALCNQIISILGYGLVQLPDLLFFIYDRLNIHYMREMACNEGVKASTSTIITVIEADSHGSLTSVCDSKSLNQLYKIVV